ncbi:hypothetical protein AAFF_G00320340 [Aldrovandia affinis]|uniref:Histone deacetylase domain-containing protein n=1 Tax=Aldrovandia affinis TaxID=143900 RepID=A0AAD7R6Z5_9TELE|nr:hypothetical protein AAFF_G00320340 [Aldrovandia affinis]
MYDRHLNKASTRCYLLPRAMASGTALVYDEEMTRYKLLWVDPACKVEVPERLTACVAALQEQGLAQRCVAPPVRPATEEDILLAHSEQYLEAVKRTPLMTLEELCPTQHTEVCHVTKPALAVWLQNIYHCAKLAIGATLQLVDRVMTGQVRNGMALVRPPGHHSQRSAANGFCVFNNVAIAALYAKKRFNIKRVLIVDWDVHHGQGLQYCFEEDPSVLYFSWHRYEHQSFWPNLRDSDYHSVGKGPGAGFNINLPWNQVGMDNSDYLSAFFHVLLPVAYEFNPELVLVSAGFDSGIGDPEGLMRATPDVFAHLTHLLTSLAGGKLCAVLEGGYNLTCLAQSVCQTVQTLLGDPAPRPSGLSGPCESALESIQCVRAVHRQYWGCLKHTERDLVSSPPLLLPLHPPAAGEGDGSSLGETQHRAQQQEGGGGDGLSPCLARLPPDRTQDRRRWRTGEGGGVLQALGHVRALLDKICRKEVQNGLAVVADVSVAVAYALQRAVTSLTNRVLLVFLGDGEVPVEVTEEGKVLVFQICSKEPRDRKSKYHIPVCLRKQGGDGAAGFLHAVLSLLLPLGYGYDPGLVLTAVGTESGVGQALWAQLTSLLQGLAQGHTLALMQQGCGEGTLRATACSLLGGPAPAVGPLGAPAPENVREVERQRERLQGQWGLLRTAGPAEGSSAAH